MYRTVKRVAFGTPHRRSLGGFADGGTRAAGRVALSYATSGDKHFVFNAQHS